MKITKIALTGSHGVGKTTLANELLRCLSGKGFGVVAVAPEAPREICSLAADPEFFRRGKNNALKQALLMYAQLQHEHFSLPKQDGILICDRSVLDLWAYSKYLFRDEFRAGGVLEIYEALVAEYCRSYRCHFYIPAEFPPADDGVRESDSEFQVSIDRTIREFLEKYAVTHRKTSGTLDERCRIVEAELRALASQPNATEPPAS